MPRDEYGRWHSNAPSIEAARTGGPVDAVAIRAELAGLTDQEVQEEGRLWAERIWPMPYSRYLHLAGIRTLIWAELRSRALLRDNHIPRKPRRMRPRE
jgi:hypothetical protein